MKNGFLTLCTSPLGDKNLEISNENIEAILNCDIIAYESIKRAEDILNFNKIKYKDKKMICIGHPINNEDSLINNLINGEKIVVLVDEGQAGYADPGAKLINLAYSNNIKVNSIPGPSSCISAAVLSGYSLTKLMIMNFYVLNKNFVFDHIKNNKDTTYVLIEIQDEKNRIVEFPEYLYDRKITICSNLGSSNQEIWRGLISEVPLANKTKNSWGRSTCVIQGEYNEEK